MIGAFVSILQSRSQQRKSMMEQRKAYEMAEIEYARTGSLSRLRAATSQGRSSVRGPSGSISRPRHSFTFSTLPAGIWSSFVRMFCRPEKYTSVVSIPLQLWELRSAGPLVMSPASINVLLGGSTPIRLGTRDLSDFASPCVCMREHSAASKRTKTQSTYTDNK